MTKNKTEIETQANTATPALRSGDLPVVEKTFRLQFEDAQDSWVLLYPEGMVKLSQSAGEILKRCDGQRDITTIVLSLEEAFEQKGLTDEVMGFLTIAQQQKWVVLATTGSNGASSGVAELT